MKWQLRETLSGTHHDLVKGTKLSLSPQPRDRYYLIDTATQKTPTDVTLVREGDTLYLRSSEYNIEVALNDFWQVCQEGTEQCFLLLDSPAQLEGALAGQSVVSQGAAAIASGSGLLAGEIVSLSEGQAIVANSSASSVSSLSASSTFGNVFSNWLPSSILATAAGAGALSYASHNREQVSASHNPVLASHKPSSSGSDKPVSGSHQPSSGSDKPVSGSHQPSSGSDKPVSGSDKPVSGSDKPVSGSDKPVSGSHQPSSGNDKPVSGSDHTAKTVEQHVEVLHSSPINDVSSDKFLSITSENGNISSVDIVGTKGSLKESVSHNGQAQIIGLNAQQLAILGEGKLAITVITHDSLGNTSAPNHSQVMVDTTAPLIDDIKSSQIIDSHHKNTVEYYQIQEKTEVLARVIGHDQGSNFLRYQWAKGNNTDYQNWFDLNPETGEITLSQAGLSSPMNGMTDERLESVHLSVEVVDLAGNISQPTQITFRPYHLLNVDAVEDYLSDIQYIDSTGNSIEKSPDAIHTSNQSDVLQIGIDDSKSGSEYGVIHNTSFLDKEKGFVFMMDGNDRVSIGKNLLGYSMTLDSRVYLGKGDDFLETKGDLRSSEGSLGVMITGTRAVAIFAEEGNDHIEIGGNVIRANIFAGSGDDFVLIKGYLEDKAIIDLGSRMDFQADNGDSYQYYDPSAAKGMNSLGIFGTDNNTDTAENHNTLIVNGIYNSRVLGTAGDDTILVGIDENNDGQVDVFNDIKGSSIIDLGDGHNILTAKGLYDSVKITGGAGVDVVTIQKALGAGLFGKVEVDLGAGDDVFVYEGSYQHDAGFGATLNKVSIRGAEGIDTLKLTLNDSDKSYSNHDVTGMSTQQFTGFERVVLQGTSILDVETQSYLNDHTRSEAMKISYSGDLANIAKVGVDLGSNQLNSTIQDTDKTKDLDGWEKTGTQTENNITYDIYSHSSASIDNIIWIQHGISVF